MINYSDYNYNPFENKSNQESFYVQGGFKQESFIEKGHRRELVNLINRIDGYVNESNKKNIELNVVKRELIGVGNKIFTNGLNQFNFIKENLLKRIEQKQSHLESIKDTQTNTLAQVKEKENVEKEIKNLKKKLKDVISLINKFDHIKHQLDCEITKIPESSVISETSSIETIKKTFTGLFQTNPSNAGIEFLRNIQKEYKALVEIYDIALNIESELASKKSQDSKIEDIKRGKNTCLRLIHDIKTSINNHKATKKSQLKSELVNQSNLDTSLIENYLVKLNEKIIRNQLNLEMLESDVADRATKNKPSGDEIFERISYLTHKIAALKKKHLKIIEHYEIIQSSIKELKEYAGKISNEKNPINSVEQIFDKLIHNYSTAINLSDEQLFTKRKEEFLGLEEAKNSDPVTVDLLLHAYNELKLESHQFLDSPNDFKSKRAKKLLSQINMLVKQFVHSMKFKNHSDFKKIEFVFIMDFLMKLQITTRALPAELLSHHSKLASIETGLFSSNAPIEIGFAVALKVWCMNYIIDKAAHVIFDYKKNTKALNQKNTVSVEAEPPIKLIEEIISGYGWAIEDQANYVSFGLGLTELAVQLPGNSYVGGTSSLAGLFSSGATLATMAKENPIGKIKDEELFLKNFITVKERELKSSPHLKSLQTLIEILKLRLEFISNKGLTKTLFSIGTNTLDFLNSATSVGGTIAGLTAPAAATTAIAATGYATAGISVLLLSLGGIFLYLTQKRSIQSKLKVEEQKKHLEGINKKLEYLVSNLGLPKHLAKGDQKLQKQYAGLNSEQFIHEYKNLQHKALACKQIIAKELDRKFIGSIADLDSNTRIEIERIRNEIQKKIETEETYNALLDFLLDHAPTYVDQFKIDPATAILDYVYATSVT